MRILLKFAGAMVLVSGAMGVAQDATPNPGQDLARVSRELQETRAELKESRRQIEELRQGLEALRNQVQALSLIHI